MPVVFYLDLVATRIKPQNHRKSLEMRREPRTSGKARKPLRGGRRILKAQAQRGLKCISCDQTPKYSPGTQRQLRGPSRAAEQSRAAQPHAAPPYCSEQGAAASSILCTLHGKAPTQLLTEPKLGPLELSHHLKQCGKAHASRIYGGQVPEKHPSYTIIFLLESENGRCFNSFIHAPNSKQKGCHAMGPDVNAVQRLGRPL